MTTAPITPVVPSTGDDKTPAVPVVPAVPIVPAVPVVPAEPKFNYPADTPIADMTSEQQAEYWREKSQKHEKLWQSMNLSPKELQDLRDKAKKADELEAAQLTDHQRLEKRAIDAENKLAAETNARLKAEVASDKGITGEGLSFLSGATKEELEASADALLAFRGQKPRADFGAGDRGDPVGGKPDFDAQIAEATKNGKFQQVIALKQAKAKAEKDASKQK